MACCSLRAFLFVLLFSICYLIYTVLFTFVLGVNRSMKRHFRLSDCGLGWLHASAGLAYAVTVTAMSYFGGRSNNKGRWVGGGFLLVALGCLLVAVSAFVAPLPAVDHPRTEERFWTAAFVPLSDDDISTSKKLAKTQLSARFPEDVRNYLANNDFRFEGVRNKRSSEWPLEMRVQAGRALDRLRRDLRLENVDDDISRANRRVWKRELPDWEFPDDLKDRLVNGFTNAVAGFYVFSWDSYDEFATRLYNLSHDPDIFERSMKASRLPFGYCRNASGLIRRRLNEEKCKEKPEGMVIFGLVVAFAGFVLIGVGSTTIWTVGITLLDDSMWKTSFPLCSAIIFGLQIISFIIGVVAALLLEFAVYANFSPPEDLKAIDPRWVGGWWLEFVGIGVLLTITAVLMTALGGGNHSSSNGMAYSRTPAEQSDHRLIAADALGATGRGIGKGFVQAIFDVCRPPIFITLMLAMTFDALAMKGYFDFLPKFMENNYSPSIWKGALPFWVYSVGIFLGGIVFRFARLEGRKAAFYIVASTLLAAVFSLAQSHSFFGCNNVVHRVQQIGLANSTNGQPMWPSCHGCICDTAEFYPVCANNSDNTPFYSPCHAGCTNFTYEVVGTNVEFHFDYCFCAPATRMRVSRDSCKDDCSRPSRVYIILSSLAALLSGNVIVPLILFVLRTAVHRLRSLALGVIGLSVCVFGLLPSALIYRFIADSTCFLWRATCPSSTGHGPTCEIFDGPTLRYRLHLFLGVLRLLSVVFYALAAYHAKDVKLYAQVNHEIIRETELSESPKKVEDPPKFVEIGQNNLIGKM